MPIYRILLFSKIPTQSESGWPDYGAADNVGFYYEKHVAIKALHENWCDIQDHCNHAGFIIEQPPGLYSYSTEENRIYFEWDEEKKGFFEAKEPECLKHFSF